MSVIVLIVACSVGIYFGLYCGFLVLVPLTLLAMIASGVVSAWQGQPISSDLLAIVIPAVGLQGGYMIGLTGRDFLGQFISRLQAAAPSRGL
jgi:hypothetical protein